MSEQDNEQVLPAKVAFVTTSEAQSMLEQLIAQAPSGGTLLGTTTSFSSHIMLSTEDGDSWRIGVIVELPHFANMIFGQLARWGFPGARKSIAFVIKAKANAVKIDDHQGPLHKAHSYTVLNGTFQSRHHLSTEMDRARPFRDRTLRMWYNTTFDSTEFEQVLSAVRSELTGEAFSSTR